jgi:uncharacterized LabA/DUF88 family protein
MTERTRRVVLLIDYDNLQICAARDTPGRDLQLPPVVQLAQRYGTVILARAYAEWNLSTERLAVYKAGIEPAFAPVLRTESDRSGKSLADTVMVAEGMDMLWTLSPEVVVLATSDKDLIPLARVAKQRGAFVVVLGSDFTAIPLREMADEHVTYRQLISDTGVRYATEAGPGRQPAALPEPSRRRRERTGRERGSTATPAPSVSTPTAAPAHAASVAAPAPAPSAEPVAPITSTASGEADSQTSGRRRRRRGSRRRSDRLGVGIDGALGEGEVADGDDGEDVDETEDLTAAPEGGLPTPGASEVSSEVGEAAEVSNVAGAASAETVLDVEAEAEAVAQAVEIEGAPAEVAPVAAVEEAPVARERRPRRTRRRVTDAPEAEVEPTVADEPEQAGAAPAAIPDSADITPAPPPEEASVNGAPAVDETPEPARRPRRVASASRGRSRRP